MRKKYGLFFRKWQISSCSFLITDNQYYCYYYYSITFFDYNTKKKYLYFKLYSNKLFVLKKYYSKNITKIGKYSIEAYTIISL